MIVPFGNPDNGLIYDVTEIGNEKLTLKEYNSENLMHLSYLSKAEIPSYVLEALTPVIAEMNDSDNTDYSQNSEQSEYLLKSMIDQNLSQMALGAIGGAVTLDKIIWVDQ